MVKIHILAHKVTWVLKRVLASNMNKYRMINSTRNIIKEIWALKVVHLQIGETSTYQAKT